MTSIWPHLYGVPALGLSQAGTAAPPHVPRVVARCVTPYALSLAVRTALPWGERRPVAARLSSPWGERRAVAARHRALWRVAGAGVAARLSAPYALDALRRHVRGLRTPWALLDDGALVPVANTPELIHAGRVLRVASADLSCDEDSPVWLARIRLADVADLAAIGLLDAVTLMLGVETFSLVVDGRGCSRPEVAEAAPELSAVSPLALCDAPWAMPLSVVRAEAVPARGLVEEMIGPVDWQLPEWTIPAGRVAFEGATPLAIARAVVEAAGGLVESAPDGTAICRRRHPVSVPAYASALPAIVLADRALLSLAEQVSPAALTDRVTVSNEAAAGGPEDRIEYEAAEGDATRGTVRAWPWPVRPVALVHTGHPETRIVDLDVETREVVEMVEFVDGQATARWPVTAWLAVTWMRADLGAVRAERTRLTASVAGFSLAQVRYATAARTWAVSLEAAAEEVQFVLMDE